MFYFQWNVIRIKFKDVDNYDVSFSLLIRRLFVPQ